MQIQLATDDRIKAIHTFLDPDKWGQTMTETHPLYSLWRDVPPEEIYPLGTVLRRRDVGVGGENDYSGTIRDLVIVAYDLATEGDDYVPSYKVYFTGAIFASDEKNMKRLSDHLLHTRTFRVSQMGSRGKRYEKLGIGPDYFNVDPPKSLKPPPAPRRTGSGLTPRVNELEDKVARLEVENGALKEKLTGLDRDLAAFKQQTLASFNQRIASLEKAAGIEAPKRTVAEIEADLARDSGKRAQDMAARGTPASDSKRLNVTTPRRVLRAS